MFELFQSLPLEVTIPVLTTMIVGVASSIAPFIPQAAAAIPVLKVVKRVIDIAACNFKNAKNIEDRPKIAKIKTELQDIFNPDIKTSEKWSKARGLIQDVHKLKNTEPHIYYQVHSAYSFISEVIDKENKKQPD